MTDSFRYGRFFMLQADQVLVQGHTHGRRDTARPAHWHDRAAQARTPDVKLFISHDLAAVEGEWRRFEREADCTAFQSFDWLSAWQRHVGARTRTTPAIVIGRDADGRTLFILPLATGPRGLFTRLTFLGRDLGDYNAPLLAPDFQRAVGPRFPELWREICARLQAAPAHRHDLVLLDKMPERVGDQPNPFLRLEVAPHPSGAYLTTLFGPWEAIYLARRSPGGRKRDRNKRRRLADAGAVRMVTPVEFAERESTLLALIDQKQKSFARMGVRNLFDQPGYRAFFLDLATRPGLAELVHVGRLEVGAQCASTNLGLVFRERFYHLLTSYEDGPLSRIGAGSIYLQELMAYAVARGCTLFDFTIGDEAYKRDWSDTVLVLHDHVAGASWRGGIAAAVMAGGRRLKRAIKQSSFWPAAMKARARIGQLVPRRSGRGGAPPAEGNK